MKQIRIASNLINLANNTILSLLQNNKNRDLFAAIVDLFLHQGQMKKIYLFIW